MPMPLSAWNRGLQALASVRTVSKCVVDRDNWNNERRWGASGQVPWPQQWWLSTPVERHHRRPDLMFQNHRIDEPDNSFLVIVL